MEWFVAGTVDFEYLNHDGVLVRPEGKGRRAWGPCVTQERAEAFRDMFATLPGFSDLWVIQGKMRGDGEHRKVLRAA